MPKQKTVGDDAKPLLTEGSAKDENKYRNEYQERQPKMRPVKDMFNQEFVVMALLFVAFIVSWSAYRLMPIELYRSTLDTCVSLTAILVTCGLVLSFAVWFDSH